MTFSREAAASMGAEAVDIIEAGRYVSPSGRLVRIGTEIERSKSGTVSYPPDRDCPRPASGVRSTHVRVLRATTLDAAVGLDRQGLRPAALNFASALTPGGGFLVGARAQEESLCWSSALYACLADNEMYAYHLQRDDPIYSDYVLYSPDVPVFRGSDGALLEEPWACSFLTSPAPIATLDLTQRSDGAARLEQAFASRIAKVLAVAARHGHETLVLGAWGCGAFGNDPVMVARRFREALRGPFAGVFSEVVFAIHDASGSRARLAPFEDAFGAS